MTTDFYSIGTEYAADYDNSEDAWEHAISNDDRVINALRAGADREDAADQFGLGFAVEATNDPELLDMESTEIAEGIDAVTWNDGSTWFYCTSNNDTGAESDDVGGFGSREAALQAAREYLEEYNAD